MESCWKVDPSARPIAAGVLSKLQPNTWTLATELSAWDDSLSREIWNNVDHQICSTIPPRSVFEFPPPPTAHGQSSTHSAGLSPLPDIPVQPDHFYDGQPIHVIPESDGKTWLDPDDDRLAARGIPVFKPTMEEFRDFESYMKRVEPWGMNSGIVKVIPPQEWCVYALPPLKEQLSGVKIRAPLEQYMSGQTGLFRLQFLEKRKTMSVREWTELCSQDEYRAPGVGEVGVHARVSVVAKPRTRTRKSTTSKAETVEPAMDEDESVGDVAVSVHESGSRSSDEAPDREGQKLKTKGRLNRQSQKKQTKEAKLAERAEKDTAFLETFDPHAHWLPPDTKPEDYTPEFCAKLERQYWRNCGLGKPPWWGADNQGSLYTDDTKEWNFAHLESELSRILPSSTVIPGVNTPYLYWGMWRTTYAWRVEDVDLFGIYYLHFGAPKFWYAVPQRRATSLENVMQSFFPQDASQCPQFLQHKSFLASPTSLANSSCKPNHCVQHADEFIITYPKGYNASFDLGLNCTESAHFALASWLELGKVVKACECISDGVRIDVGELLDQYRRKRSEGSESSSVSASRDPGTSSGRSKRPPPGAKAPSLPSKRKRTKVG
ncbi:JmjC-domain-containing protein [Marasmius fiardii PR-910]|nr:JmjC-domain-containing protein [Marasmius fiardii PR-910]